MLEQAHTQKNIDYVPPKRQDCKTFQNSIIKCSKALFLAGFLTTHRVIPTTWL